jgi:AcrR family transcriptional regulator
MARNPTATRRSEQRREQLTSVAAELFSAHGFHGVGINDIARAAGLTGPAVYRHFPDKRALLAHVLLSGLDGLDQMTREATEQVPSSATEIEALLERLATVAVDRRDIAALWRWEGRHLAPAEQQEVARRSAAVMAGWTAALRRVRPELSEADAELLCWAVLSVFGSVGVHRTSIAKRSFTALLVRIAARVLRLNLPGADAPEPPPAAGLAPRNRREQLLDAATELFDERGFAAVSVEDIGAATGIAGPSVYRHFANKRALLWAICQRATHRLELGADEALCASGPPTRAAALRRLCASYVATLTGARELAVSFSSDPGNLLEQQRIELLDRQRAYVQKWVQLLGEVDSELDRRAARITVYAVLTMANDLVRTRRTRSRPNLPAELVVLMSTALGVPEELGAS